MIPYGRQFLDKDDIEGVVEALKSDYLTTGPKVQEFESAFASKVGSKYAVAVSSGTAALHLSCLAAGLKPGEESITSPITFVASANCALYCGARPVFSDVGDDGLIDTDQIGKNISRKTKVLIPVHYSGTPCDMEGIKEIADKNNLITIEDAAHALGAKYNKTNIGDCTYSDMTIFSFHPVKHITTGEGGMITTNSRELYEKLSVLRSHGITKSPEMLVRKNEGRWYQEMQELGFNYRITDMQCALGLSQLKKLDQFVKRRQEIARRYDDAFGGDDNISIRKAQKDRSNAYHLYVIRVRDAGTRLKLFERLWAAGILCQVHYLPVYLHPYYEKLGYKKGLCPNSERFYEGIISLPIYPSLSEVDQDYVISVVKGFFR